MQNHALKFMRLMAFMASFGLLLTACSKDDPIDKDEDKDPDPEQLEVKIFKNLEADLDSKNIPGYFSFETGDVVSASDAATDKWDIAFAGTTIYVNGGTSGPGQGAAQIVSNTFEGLTKAPADGYKQDTESGYAIPTGSGNGWYSYNALTHVITPLAGKVIVLKTAKGKYAKLEIISYYKDAPTNPNALTSKNRHYTFRYVYQPDGSTNLN